MYGSRRMNYDPGVPLGTPVELLDVPMDGEQDQQQGYFDYAEGWQTDTLAGPQQNMVLDAVDELERDLMGFESQYPVMPSPQQMQLAMQGSGIPGQMQNQMQNQMRGLPGRNQMGPMGQIGNQMGNQMGSQMGDGNQMGNQMGNQIGNQNQMGNTNQMGTNQMGNQNQMGNANQMGNQMGNTNQLGTQMHPMQRNTRQGSVHDSRNHSVPSPGQAVQLDPQMMQHMRMSSPRMPPRSLSSSSVPVQQQGLIPSQAPSMPAMPSQPMQPQSMPSQPMQSQSMQSIQMAVDSPADMNAPHIEELRKSRVRYKPRSSIPPDLSSANYAAQCIAAAESSRLSPYCLSLGEFNHLRTKLPYIHITTYLNIRNGILRLWLANPLISVTLVEAAGCCKEARYYRLAEFAFEWLVRNGYINQGCCAHQDRASSSAIAEQPQFSMRRRKRKQTIVVLGAGVAGLCCARQLENLLERYSSQILADYEDLPRVLVLEGRKRIGGRVYSPLLRTEKLTVDLGGDTIMGFGGGNPLGVVMRRQLGIPVVSIDTVNADNVLYDGDTGEPISAQVDYRAHEIFKHLLDRMRNFEMGLGAMSQPPSNAPGVKSLIKAGQDPPTNVEAEKITISQHEEDVERPYTRVESDNEDSEESAQEIKLELDFLESLGFATETKSQTDKEIRVHAEPANQGASLGLTMRRLIEHLSTLTDLTDKDREALNWYFAKFEYFVGDDIDKASLSSWSHHRQNRFTGRHAWSRDGMSALARGLDSIPSKLDVRFKTVVNVIEYEDENAQITLENGEQVMADRVVVTAPLGCLKRRNLQFIPDLPQWKMDSIDRLEFGVVNKVVLLFDEPFWDSDMPAIIRVTCGNDDETRGSCFVFQNHSRRQDPTGKGLIVGLVSGKAAKAMSSKPDYEIIEPAVEKLRRVFKNNPRAQTAKLVESVVTRWEIDRFSRGSFSHVGVEGTTTDHDLLARPVLRSLFFAGEATSRMYPGTIHGAYISGLRAAKEVLNSIVGGIEVPNNLLLEDVDEFIDGGKLSVHSNTPGQDLAGMDVQNQQRYQSAGAKLRPPMSRQNTQSHIQASASPGSDIISGNSHSHSGSNYGTTPNGSDMGNSNNMVIANGGNSSSSSLPKRHGGANPESMPTYEPLDITKAETELADLRKRRNSLEQEHLERDMLHELGPQPVKPERQGTTNPFLLFQKDYWEICRQETEAAKRNDKKSGQFHASRNEIRASLGKKWRSLPEADRAPYIERSRLAKFENEERQEVYMRKLKWYESEAANFRQQWLQEHPSTPSLRERYLEEQLEGYRPRKKRTRLTD